MNHCFFVSDLHGRQDRYRKLLDVISQERPAAVFLGGDLLPLAGRSPVSKTAGDLGFISGFLLPGFTEMRTALRAAAPEVFLILGNDDPRSEEPAILQGVSQGLWRYVHGRMEAFGPWKVYGYAFVPPTPFRLKDWERYDVSRFVDPGCYSPEDGYHTYPYSAEDLKYSTIQQDLAALVGEDDLERAIFLFHTPPYDTPLDLTGLAGKYIDHAPLDPHIGSIAVRRFIEERQPRITLHGHAHEAARLSGVWKTKLGRAHCFNAAHDGPELALVRFAPEDPSSATRELV